MNIETAKELNSNCHSAIVDRGALEHTLHEQGEVWHHRVNERCPHLFAAAPLFISSGEMEQMHAVIGAIQQVVALPAWHDAVLQYAPAVARYAPRAKGVFFGYDFHLNAEGAHLIEINTNAGGALFNALQLHSQRGVVAPGKPAAMDNLEHVFLDMFRNEWCLERGDAPLQTIAIVDEQPREQYFYPEFVLMQQLFERAGITAYIADPAELEVRANGLYLHERKIDLIYNRLTDFSLQQYSAINTAYQSNQVVLTPHPHVYALYADKRNLALLTAPDGLRVMGVAETTIAALMKGIPQTRLVDAQAHEHWRQQRKQWFFKPATGYGGKGTYRGANITNRVFADIIQGGYIAQRMAPPGERMICLEGAEPVALKSDVRCYVYDGQVQLIAARLYQGQTTNFRTAGGGFAPVRVVA
ncbi:conserved hypothetical protein [Candidatus Nitrotoga sp. HW29]|uniref:hypothetical protein n=1 Tax=Candidatus Nitrotoga sp. HW29 TaxID=2886963 RepID=UPI001EF2DEC8|nr:hypothetical protein [Candidatus Nitrotoga sp. HW29]CAH1905675.1 conserved hypothetical protein [Candidatus Nitrotoga sp. HW29]